MMQKEHGELGIRQFKVEILLQPVDNSHGLAEVQAKGQWNLK